MSAPAIDKVYTPDDLLNHPNRKGLELVSGQLLEKNMGAGSSYVSANVLFLLMAFVRAKRLGWLFDAECGYVCFPHDSNRVRKPDVSFVAAKRLSTPPTGWIEI